MIARTLGKRGDGLWIAVFTLVCLYGSASMSQAGESRGMTIPLRTTKIQKGDWFVYRMNGELIKDTATEVDNDGDDYLVKYTSEKFDDNGNSLSVMEAAQFLSIEKENAAELNKDRSVKRERKRVSIGGKNVDVLSVTFSGEAPYSLWFSDAFSISGTVAMVAEIPGSEPFWSIQPLAYGGAGNSVDIRKFLSSK